MKLIRNTVSQKIDFEAVWPRNGHAASVGVNKAINALLTYKQITTCKIPISIFQNIPYFDRLPHIFPTLQDMIMDDIRRRKQFQEFSKTQSILWLTSHIDFIRHIFVEFKAGRTDTKQIFLVRSILKFRKNLERLKYR